MHDSLLVPLVELFQIALLLWLWTWPLDWPRPPAVRKRLKKTMQELLALRERDESARASTPVKRSAGSHESHPEAG